MKKQKSVESNFEKQRKVGVTNLSTNVGSSARIAFADHHPVVPNAKKRATSVVVQRVWVWAGSASIRRRRQE